MAEQLLDDYTESVLKRIVSPTTQHRKLIRQALCLVATYMEDESDYPEDEGVLDFRIEEFIGTQFDECTLILNGEGSLSHTEGNTVAGTLSRYIIIAGVNMWSTDTSLRYDCESR